MLARLQSHIFKSRSFFFRLSLSAVLLFICSVSGAAFSAEWEERLEWRIADYKKRMDAASTELRTYDFFASLSSIYKADTLFVKGIYYRANYPFYQVANLYLPTTGGLVKEADSELLNIARDVQYLADTERNGCVAPDLFANTTDIDLHGSLSWLLRMYKVAAGFHEFEKKETGLSMPPEYLEQLQAKIKAVENFIVVHSSSSPSSCLDLKLLMAGFDEPESLMAKVKSRPDFLPGPCPYFEESVINAWPDKEEVTSMDTVLGVDYVKVYMRNLPIGYTRAPREMTKEDFKKAKVHFIKVAHAYSSGDFYFSRKMYTQAFEQYDIAAKNIPSFINLSRRADAWLMRFSEQAPDNKQARVKEQLLEIIEEYKAALVVYKFELCEELIDIPLMEMARQGSKINCLKKIATSNMQPDALTACLRDDRPIYRRCIELVNHPRWSCPGKEI